MTADTFDAFEVFEIAEQIERNAAKFYRGASETFEDGDIRQTLLNLAEWETEHERIFAGMRRRLASSDHQSGLAMSRQIVGGPRAMAGLAAFGIRPDPRDELKGAESRADVLSRALGKEKESIAFYEGLKDFAVEAVGIEKIDEIIEEERRHVAILNKLLQ